MFSRALHILNASLLQPSSPRFHLNRVLCHIRGSHCVDHHRVPYQGSPVVPGDQSLAIRSLSIKSGKARRFPDSQSAIIIIIIILEICNSWYLANETSSGGAAKRSQEVNIKMDKI